jgi:hypothetical protein
VSQAESQDSPEDDAGENFTQQDVVEGDMSEEGEQVCSGAVL